MSEMTREKLLEALDELGFGGESDRTQQAALCLLASLHVGPNIKRVASLTGLSRSTVAEFSANLRKSGVWSGGSIFANWNDEEMGWTDFLLDCMVADGVLERA